MSGGINYVSRQAPIVEAGGAVPEDVQRALAGLVGLIPGKGGTHRQRATLLQAFLAETCQALAQARAQVLADRAELDGWRNRYRGEQRSA